MREFILQVIFVITILLLGGAVVIFIGLVKELFEEVGDDMELFKKDTGECEPGLKTTLEILTYLKEELINLDGELKKIEEQSGEYFTMIDAMKMGNIKSIFAFINHLISFIENGTNAEKH